MAEITVCASTPAGALTAEYGSLSSMHDIAGIDPYGSLEPHEALMSEDGENAQAKPLGVKSLFSDFNTVVVNYAGISNRRTLPLKDSRAERVAARDKTRCTVADLVAQSSAGNMGRAMYRTSDFMYCMHLGEVPNSRLITLRRFDRPVTDNILVDYDRLVGDKKRTPRPDIGRLVTWMGVSGNKMEDILSYSLGMNWKELSADIKDEDADSHNGGILNKIGNIMSKNYGDMVRKGAAPPIFLPKSMPGSDAAPDAAYYKKTQGQYDTNKVYGPLDVVMKTQIRDRGLNFNQDIKLCFEYEMAAYAGINTKMAFLDLLANILAVCGNTGRFWGGEIRLTGVPESQFIRDVYKGVDSASSPYDAGAQFLSNIGDQISSLFKGGFIDGLKNIASTVGSGLMSGALGALFNAAGRPNMQAFSSLLSPEPTGMWHLTIGNPRDPIMSIGNLIMTNATVTHFGELSIDGFPTKIKVDVTLSHGKPRDIMNIERMYGYGDRRIYIPMDPSAISAYYSVAGERKRADDSAASDSAVKQTEPATEDGKQGSLMESVFGAGVTDADVCKMSFV